MILEDEDIKQTIQLHLLECAKARHITAGDIVEIVSTPELQEKFLQAGIMKPTISKRTACRWLSRLDWQYGQPRKGMYIDGHEHEDIVEYGKAFVNRWKEYEKCFYLWDNNDDLLPLPNGFPVPKAHGHFCLILVTHDESTFFQNDLQKTCQEHKGNKPTPQPKGNGQSLMVSDFLTADWGHLCDRKDREARITFKPGLICDRYFDANNLLEQVEGAIDIFEGKTRDYARGYVQGLFPFDNAPSHQKQAPNALFARNIAKNSRVHWTPFKDGLRMHHVVHPQTKELQSFYFPDDHPTMPGWFKGMEQIIQSMVFGQRLVCMLSAHTSNALKDRQTAAAAASSLISLTLFLRSHSFKSLLSSVATSVIFTPSTTVS
ncbi:hypothetical protein EDB92DRAFT_1796554 [Lactarius akahatsu]|uniref:Uncharacterized protein n=1 Tax=Lactarius akahatsu TaxID=416441 RepID=A0AAD4QEP1_9AGAM|nr:hypothetical protein EDB92DRAFT_1796554 [Lactarius akahatsu]